jgi:hypothetical protein
VQQRIVVTRTLLAGVAERLIALGPLLVHAWAEIPDHACETVRTAAGSARAGNGSGAHLDECVSGSCAARNPTVLKRLLRRLAG